jgi:hypothetical protein
MADHNHDPVFVRLQQLRVGQGEERVVPLDVEVPVAACGDLRLRDDADVDVVGSEKI